MLALLAASSASGGITSEQVLAFCAVASVAIAVLVAYNSWLKSRSEVREDAREKEAEDDEVKTAQYEALKTTVEHLALVMVGRPAQDGMPAVKGFVDEQREFNLRVENELTDANGGGTLRGAVHTLRREVRAMKGSGP